MAFTSRPNRDQVFGRLIVRRVKRLNRPSDQAAESRHRRPTITT